MTPYREPPVFIRFFCPVNATPLSSLARAYVEAFLVLQYPVRVIATRMAELAALPKAWAAHRGRFLTPIGTPFVNVVCGEPFDWHRLYTANVKNILVASSPPELEATVPGLRVKPHNMGGGAAKIYEEEPAIAAQVAARYDAIVVPTLAISSEWAKRDLLATVVPTDIGPNAAILRGIINASSLPTREQPQKPPT